MTSVTTLDLTYEKEQHRSSILAAGLRRMAAVLSSVDVLQREVSRLLEEAQHVEDGRFSIVVLGAFNRGKSTLLNAMVGRHGLPIAAVPSTAIISVLRYGQSDHVMVHLLNGNVEGPLSLDDFKARFVLQPTEVEMESVRSADGDLGKTDDTDEGDALDDTERERRRLDAARDRFSYVDYSEIALNCDLLKHGVEFVDPPGFEDDDARTKRARDFLAKADAVIYVLDATMSMTDADERTLDWIVSLGHRAIFFVINKWNILEIMERTPAGRRQVEQRFHSKLQKYLPDKSTAAYDHWVFKVNALDAFDARQARPVNKAMLDAAGLPRLENLLEQFLVEHRIKARDRALLAKAETACRIAQSQLQRTRYLGSQTLQQLAAKRAAITPKVEQLRTIRRHIGGFIEDQLIATQKQMADRLNQHMGAVDTKRLMAKLNLDVLNTFFAKEAIKDAGHAIFEKIESVWTGDAVEKNRYSIRFRQSIEPQVMRFIHEELSKWEANVANPEIQREAQRIIKYLREEAIDFKRVLDEIAAILQDQSTAQAPINVEELVNDWMRERSNHHHAYGDMDIGGLSGIALDLTPFIGSMVAELTLHLKGLAVPIVGTVLSVAVSIWRNGKTKEKLRLGVQDGLHKAFSEIPTVKQREVIDNALAAQFGRASEDKIMLMTTPQDDSATVPLRWRVLTNIDEQIAIVDRQLEDAIAAVERGDAQHKEECQRVESIERDIGIELNALLLACGSSQ